MLGRQAKILSSTMMRRLLRTVGKGAYPERDRVIVLLSTRAGLRACEIAGLTWNMALDAKGYIAPFLEVHAIIAKKEAGRRVPVHPDLNAALLRLRRRVLRDGGSLEGPLIRSARGGPMRPNSIVNWFVALYAELGFEGCSSHSGRRTFITKAARRAHQAGASLRDVQLLAGHRSIETTQGYIDGDTHAQRKLVSLI